MTIPASWKEVLLGAHASLLNGFAFPSDGFTESGGMPLIRIRDLRHQTTEINYRGRFDNKYVVHRGDLLIGMDGDFDTVRWMGFEALLNQRVCKLDTKNPDKLVQEFLFYRIIDEVIRINRITAATTVKHLSSGDVLRIRIELPPEPEQSKIAEVLSTVDRAIEQTEALIAKQQRIKTGLMQDLLTRGIDSRGNLRSEDTHDFKDSPLGRIPEEWDVVTLAQRAKQITKGESPSWQGFKYQPDGVLFVTSENVRDGYLDIQRGEKYIQPEFHKKLYRSALKKGDVLINLVGASIGRTAIFDLSDEANINQAVCSIRLTEDANPDWLCGYLQLPRSLARLLGEQVETARANVSLGHVRRFTAAFPPIEEQHRIAQIVVKHKEQVDRMFAQRDKLISAKTGLMQDLLTGKVPVTPLLTEQEVTA